jgi:hypothetical protein
MEPQEVEICLNEVILKTGFDSEGSLIEPDFPMLEPIPADAVVPTTWIV